VEFSPRDVPGHHEGSAPLPFDVDAYCSRIGYMGPRDVSSATLRGLHLAHTHSVPFENLDIHLGRPLSLEAADLFAKIVTRRRGGYCYELNGAFEMLLHALGFHVQGLLARVLQNTATLLPRTHQISLVTIENEAWISDVGSGRNSLRAPLPLRPGLIEQQGPDTFRLQQTDRQWYLLQKRVGEEWRDVYAFTLEPFLPVDYLPLNHWHSTSPRSQFTQKRICTMPTPNGRILAVDMEFRIFADRSTRTIQARSSAEYVHLLQEHFGLQIEDAFIR
jgi:N-hydroxyarylamine O-acetyltransferase